MIHYSNTKLVINDIIEILRERLYESFYRKGIICIPTIEDIKSEVEVSAEVYLYRDIDASYDLNYEQMVALEKYWLTYIPVIENALIDACNVAESNGFNVE